MTAPAPQWVSAVADLTAEERLRLERTLDVPIPYCPFAPYPIQRAFLMLDPVQDVLFGGSAGGSKSFALLMGALRYADRPGYGALLMRSTLTDLAAEPNGLIPTLAGWLEGTPAVWREKKLTWYFPSGATISFGYLRDPDDHLRYKGPSWQFIGIDQAEEIRPKHLLFMFSRLRRPEGSTLPIRYRLTANPGGRSHDFLAERYRIIERDLDPRDPAIPGGRAFLPSFLDDNPGLDRPAYELALSQLGELEYAQMRHGDWGATVAGAMFKVHLLDGLNEAPAGLRLVRAWDQAATEAVPGTDPDWTVGMLLGRRGETLQDPDPLEVILDVVRLRAEPDGVDRAMRATAAADGAAVPIVVEQEGRSAGKREIGYIRRNIATLGPGYRVTGVEPVGTKLERASPAARWMNAGRMAVLAGAPWVGDLVAELRQVGPEYRGHDDQMDALAIGHTFLDRRRTRPGIGRQLAETRIPPRAPGTLTSRR